MATRKFKDVERATSEGSDLRRIIIPVRGDEVGARGRYEKKEDFQAEPLLYLAWT